MKVFRLVTFAVLVLTLRTDLITSLPLEGSLFRYRRGETPTEPPPDYGDSYQHGEYGNVQDRATNDHGNAEPSTANKDNSVLDMSRPGELPPIAMPMFAGRMDGQTDAPTGGSDSPVALPLTDPKTDHQVYDKPQDIPMETGNTDGKKNADVPIALPMTGGNDAPVAMAQNAGGRRARAGKQQTRRPSAKSSKAAPGLVIPPAGKTRAPPNWTSKGPPTRSQNAPKGSVGQGRESGSQRQPPNWNAEGHEGAQGGDGSRQPPNWGHSGESNSGGPGGFPGGEMNPMQIAAMAGGDGIMGGTDTFSDMMEMQRKMMFDPRYQQNYYQMMQQYHQYQMNAMNQMFNTGNSSANGTAQVMPAMFPYNPMYGMGDEGFQGYQNTMTGMSGFNNPLCTENPDSPLCKLQSMGMMETQMEGPMGEMDMEPGEMDIEGPIASMLLRQLNMGRANVHPLHQEITLNHHILDALNKRFGVNTTQGIQQKAKDPEFQAFMFQVLQKSGEVAPGEFNANLTQAQVQQILLNLKTAESPKTLPRIASSEFTHARLTDLPPEKGEPAAHHDAVLAVDSGLGAEVSHTSPLVGHDPGASTNTSQTAELGTFEALVQDVVGTTGEANEAPEPRDRDRKKVVAVQPTEIHIHETAGNETIVAVGAAGQPMGNTNGVSSPHVQQLTKASVNPSNPSAQVVPPVPGGDIQNKDQQPGLSRDAQKAAANNPKTITNPNGANPANTATNTNQAPNPNQALIDQNRDNIPIGLKEAGIYPGSNETIPMVKTFGGRTSGTVFAIIFICLVALGIIIGPIICMLCKMKEKHDEKKRKLKALKNRDISENNIMEAMMLHDLGTKAPMTVENPGATASNYYTNDKNIYQTIDSELEHLNRGRPDSPTGNLP